MQAITKYDVLVFGAHPDDVERQMGGTIVSLTRSGYRVLIISLTSGQMGSYGTPGKRKKEFAKAARILDADSMVLEFTDTGIPNDRESQLIIARFLRTHQPTLVFAPYPERGDCLHGNHAHPDHAATGTLVRDAIALANIRKTSAAEPWYVPHLLYYMLPAGVAPNAIFPITAEEMAQAVQAVAQHVSQQPAYKGIVPLAAYLTDRRRIPHRDAGIRLSSQRDLSEGFVHVGPTVLDEQVVRALFGR